MLYRCRIRIAMRLEIAEIVDWVKIVRAKRASFGRPFSLPKDAHKLSLPIVPALVHWRSLSRQNLCRLDVGFFSGTLSIVCCRYTQWHRFFVEFLVTHPHQQSIFLAQPKSHESVRQMH